MNDCGRTGGCHGVEAVAERKERVRRRHGSAQEFRAGARRLHPGELHGVHAAHLTRTNRQRSIGGGEDHGVRFHVRADPPGEAKRLPFRRGGLPLRHDSQLAVRPAEGRLGHAISGLLHHGPDQRPDIAILCRYPLEIEGDHPQVRLGGEDRAGILVNPGRDDSLDERGDERSRGRGIDSPVEADDAAEGGERIRITRPHVRFRRAGAGRHAARVRVLDDGGGGFAEVQHDTQRRIEIEKVVVGELLALEDGGIAKPVARVLGVPRRTLMWILPVAQVLHLEQGAHPERR